MPSPLSFIDEAAVIAAHFEGDRAMYEEYKDMCRTQFAVDAQEGDAACQGGDMRSLSLLAHSLKTVLRSLGHTSLAAQAEALETLAHADAAPAACALWRLLRDDLQQLAL